MCRLCWRRNRARARADAGDERDTRRAEAIYGGHQLFLADMEHGLAMALAGGHHIYVRAIPKTLVVKPTEYVQPVLFDLARDFSRIWRTDVPPPADEFIAYVLDIAAVEHGAAHGWHTNVTSAVRRGIRLMLANQDMPGPLNASDIAILKRYQISAASVLEVLASAGMLHDDRTAPIISWFENRTAALPAAMTAELRVWFTAMREGSAAKPRLRPRADRTTRNHLTAALPLLQKWVAAGHVSLREIDKQHVLDVLPTIASQRNDSVAGLRSIFRLLKGRKLVFVNPTNGIQIAAQSGRTPMPLSIADLQNALDPASAERAALAGLLIYHGIRPRQLRSLQLVDIRDGRLHVEGRVIPLAPAVTERLSAYLDYRVRLWPATANPHLFITAMTAGRTTQVTCMWVNKTLGLPAHKYREDRILDEIHATGGNVRQASDLFGLTIFPLMRYLDTLNHPDLGGEGPRLDTGS